MICRSCCIISWRAHAAPAVPGQVPCRAMARSGPLGAARESGVLLRNSPASACLIGRSGGRARFPVRARKWKCAARSASARQEAKFIRPVGSSGRPENGRHRRRRRRRAPSEAVARLMIVVGWPRWLSSVTRRPKTHEEEEEEAAHRPSGAPAGRLAVAAVAAACLRNSRRLGKSPGRGRARASAHECERQHVAAVWRVPR